MLDDVAALGPPVDLHEVFSYPLPVQVICELPGRPRGWGPRTSSPRRPSGFLPQNYSINSSGSMTIGSSSGPGGNPMGATPLFHDHATSKIAANEHTMPEMTAGILHTMENTQVLLPQPPGRGSPHPPQAPRPGSRLDLEVRERLEFDPLG
jgi:hypothetical protein